MQKVFSFILLFALNLKKINIDSAEVFNLNRMSMKNFSNIVILVLLLFVLDG